MSTSTTASRGLVALYKKGWHQFPEIMASSFMGIVGIGLIFSAVKTYYDKDGDNRMYKDRYTVYRHDDPRVEKLKK